MARQYIIIGNGIAGVTAAATLAENDPAAQIAVFTDEKYPYYRRPWLPDFLAGRYKQEELYPYSESWYAKRHIEVHLNAPVKQIHPARKMITLASGQEVPYDALTLACGGYSFVPPIANAAVKGCFTLRTLDDATVIRDYANGRRAAVVIGGGLLGLESARGLSALGLHVTVIEVFPRLLPRQLDAEGAAILTQLIEQMGITTITGATVETIVGTDSVEGVQLKERETIPCDMVLFSAGIRPKLQLAKEAGLAVNRGVLADEHMRTSDPYIYVAGDVAEFRERIYGIIPAAIEQARVAAANMAQPQSQAYTGTTPINTLKVMGIDLTSIGIVNPEEPGYASYRRADAARGLYKKLVFKDGNLVGAILLGDRKSVTLMMRLVNRQAPVEAVAEQMLRDDFDLKSLL